MKKSLLLTIVSIVCVVAFLLSGVVAGQSRVSTGKSELAAEQPADGSTVYLPMILSQRTLRRVNAPYFNVPDIAESKFPETAIFWFGRVSSIENYADVRIGYNNTELYVYLAAFDRRLWYDTTPSPNDMTRWDAVTLLLNMDGATGGAPGANAYRFIAQLNWWEPRTAYQAAFRGNGSGWLTASVPLTTTAGWRGNAPLDGVDDRGWAAGFHVPFTSLGLSGPPSQGSIWGIGVVLHDRDDAAGTPIADKSWPETLSVDSPGTWGQLVFGLPTYATPPVASRTTTTIRHKLNGATVTDAAVGGTTGNLCPGDSNYIWNVWGEDNFGGSADFNLQNQADVADWPCFAKYYVTFPLDAIPPGKVIVSATLTLHQYGGSGEPGEAQPSLIQVFTIAEGWNESSLTWNNAPLALENVSRAWVDPMSVPLVWPGVPWTWDVSRAVAQAYANNEQQLRLALYEADGAYHSGKYFVASDTGDWNDAGRPTLRVTWGNP